MAKKKITIAAGANPFDKSVSAAEQMFAPPATDNAVLKEADIPEDDNSDVGYVGEVDNVEQQVQHIQQESEAPNRLRQRNVPLSVSSIFILYYPTGRPTS